MSEDQSKKRSLSISVDDETHEMTEDAESVEPEQKRQKQDKPYLSSLEKYFELKDSERSTQFGTDLLSLITKMLEASNSQLDDEDTKAILEKTSVHDKIRLLTTELKNSFKPNAKNLIVDFLKELIQLVEIEIPLNQIKNGRDTNNITDFIIPSLSFLQSKGVVILQNVQQGEKLDVKLLVNELLNHKNEYGASLMDYMPHVFSILFKMPVQDITPNFITEMIASPLDMFSSTLEEVILSCLRDKHNDAKEAQVESE